jgi:hypothetical protein
VTARLAFVAALVVAFGLAAPAARADGDPASDVLTYQRVFWPTTEKISDGSADRLRQAVDDAAKKGYKVRVALIADQFDLGAVGVLWKKPQDYSQFLAQELTNWNTDWVLIVMPNGYGIYHCKGKQRSGGYTDPCEGGLPSSADEKALKELGAPSELSGDYAADADTAVRRLAALHGTTIPEPSGGGRPWLPIAGGVALVALLGAAWFLLRRKRPDWAWPFRRRRTTL